MKNKIAGDLWRKLRLERLESTISQERIDERLQEIGVIALENNDFYTAVNVFRELGDEENLRVVAERCLAHGDSYYDAYVAFRFLEDRQGLFKTMRKAENVGFSPSDIAADFIGRDLLDKIENGFRYWAYNKGFNNVVWFSTGEIANMAYNIAIKYDVGVGIAKGGLFSAYIFDLFGMNIKVAEAHRKGNGAAFRWVDDINREDISGKKVLVLDKDVVSGRTTRRVLREIFEYDPAEVGLGLIHSSRESGGFTRAEGISEDFSRVHYSKKFSYKNFDKVTKKLEESLE